MQAARWEGLARANDVALRDKRRRACLMWNVLQTMPGGKDGRTGVDRKEGASGGAV